MLPAFCTSGQARLEDVLLRLRPLDGVEAAVVALVADLLGVAALQGGAVRAEDGQAVVAVRADVPEREGGREGEAGLPRGERL